MFSLKNQWLRIDIDERANVTWLEDVRSGNGNIIAAPKPVFRAAVLRTQDDDRTFENKEDMAFAGDQDITVQQEANRIQVLVRSLQTKMGRKDAEIRLTVELDGPEISFGGEVSNRSDSCIDELFYPCVGSVENLGGGAPDLLYPYACGWRFHDICRVLQEKTNREELHEISYPYPGWLSMSWMSLTDNKNSLYMASYDGLFHASTLRAKGSAQGGVSLEFNKMCFVRKGQTWQIPRTVLRVYQGAWHKGAELYAQWTRTWRKPVQPADWMQKSNGYFLVINKQQFGYESWPYSTLPELYDYAQAHGFDCLGLFGWYHTGHDNNYPDLEVSPTLGGKQGLQDGIRAVHDEGGHVTLYYQGHLMDITNSFYKREGHKWESKNLWGTPYYEFYPKFCYSDKLRWFSGKGFSTVCPSVRKWHTMMADRIDWIADFGADGALYDQIGGMPPYPCFNEEHEHFNNSPALSYTQGRLEMLNTIRSRIGTYPEFAFMSEQITDLYSQYLDCLHGTTACPGTPGWQLPKTEGAKAAAGLADMPQMFRYCFPETPITIRNGKPYVDARAVNFAFLLGFKFEMELRYDTDQIFIREDQAPDKRIYARQVADLRRRYEDYLLTGTFLSDKDILESNVLANLFESADGRRAIAVWNDSDAPIRPEITLTHGRITAWSTVTESGQGLPSLLPANSIAVFILE